METVVVYHDLPIPAEIREQHPELEVIAAETAEETREVLPEADVFITNPTLWEDAFLEGLASGDWVQATSAGYAAFPIEEFRHRQITFSNATGNYDAPVSEHVFALAFALSRNLPAFIRAQDDAEWRRELGQTLTDWTDQTMLIIGLGSIGSTVAERARGFGMTVHGVKQSPETYDGPVPAANVHNPSDWRTQLPATDLLVLTVPLTPQTRGLIDADVFERLPDHAVLVNVARGPVVDETALLDALDHDRIKGAGLDVFTTEPLPPESDLWTHDNVIITPHVGGRSAAFVDRFTSLFLENLDHRRNGEPLTNQIVP